MVLTLAPFSDVNVTSKIALWEMRSQTQDSPAPMRAEKRLETGRSASFEAESSSSSCSLPSLSPSSSGLPAPSPAIGEICHARICYYVAETQDFSPFVELATVSLVTKSKTSAELLSPSLELPFESSTVSPITKSKSTSSSPGLPFESSCLLPFSKSSTVSFEGTTSSPSPYLTNSPLSSGEVTPMDELAALDLEGIEPILDFSVAAPLSDLLWRR